MDDNTIYCLTLSDKIVKTHRFLKIEALLNIRTKDISRQTLNLRCLAIEIKVFNFCNV